MQILEAACQNVVMEIVLKLVTISLVSVPQRKMWVLVRTKGILVVLLVVVVVAVVHFTKTWFGIVWHGQEEYSN